MTRDEIAQKARAEADALMMRGNADVATAERLRDLAKAVEDLGEPAPPPEPEPLPERIPGWIDSIAGGAPVTLRPYPSVRAAVAVVTWRAPAGRYEKLAGCGSSANRFLGWNLGLHASSDLELRVGQGSVGHTPVFLPCRRSHPMLIVASFDGRVMRLWAAGRRRELDLGIANPWPVFDGPLNVGAGHWNGRDGVDPADVDWHDALHLYDRPITDEEVEQLVAHYEPITGPGGGWWNIEEPPAPPEPPKPRPNGRPEVRIKTGDPFGYIALAPSGSRVIVEGPREVLGHHLDLRKPDVEIEVPERDVVMVGVGIDRAITLAAKDIRITGFNIRDYRPRQYQHAAIEPRDFNHPDEADGFELVDSRIEDIVHGRGLSGVMNMRVSGCTILRIGAVGIGGDYGGSMIEDTEVGWCNLAGHDTWTEAASVKFTGGLRFNHDNVYRRLRLHHCDGRGGGWGDWNGQNTLIEDCYIWAISREGIAVEAWAKATLRNNRIALCNTAQQGMWDAAIMLQNSRDCIVEGNLIVVGAREQDGQIVDDEGGFAVSVGFQRRGKNSNPPQQSGADIGRFDGVRNRITGNHFVLLHGDAMTYSWLFDGKTATEPAVEGWTRQAAFDSTTWGPNRYSLGPGASRSSFDPEGTVTHYQDAWKAVPDDFRRLIGR